MRMRNSLAVVMIEIEVHNGRASVPYNRICPLPGFVYHVPGSP